MKSSDNLVFRHHDLPTQLLKIYFEKMCNVLMNGNFVNVKKSFPAVVWHKSVVMANNGWDLCWENIKPITFQFYFLLYFSVFLFLISLSVLLFSISFFSFTFQFYFLQIMGGISAGKISNQYLFCFFPILIFFTN